MAGSYTPNRNTYGVRSISLFTTSHPPTHSNKKELNDIETWVMSSSCKPSTEAIYDGLMKLSKFYERMHELILCSNQNEKWVEQLMERLVGFLDVCGFVRDIMSRYKEHVRDLQCALRRKKGVSSIRSSITRYNSFKKAIRKDVKRLIPSLKQSMLPKSQDPGHHEVVIKMVMEVTVSIFQTLLMPFVMSKSQTPKTNKWCVVVSKLIQRTRVACEEQHYQQNYDIGGLDAVLRSQCIKDGLISSSLDDACMCEAVVTQIDIIEDGLECIFRSLISTRASVLNIVSNY